MTTNDQIDPNYVTLDFSHLNNNQNSNSYAIPVKRNQIVGPGLGSGSGPLNVITPPPRLHHHQHQRPKTTEILNVSRLSNPVNDLQSNNHIQTSPQSVPSSVDINKQDHHQTSSDILHEDPRDFATFLCIFASVMTTVLVLMFYMVGEQSFRLILLVISFVSILTLCLACFLRRPTLVILGQTVNGSSNGTTSKGMIVDYNNNNIGNNPNKPYLLIFPTLFGQNPTTATTTTTFGGHATIVLNDGSVVDLDGGGGRGSGGGGPNFMFETSLNNLKRKQRSNSGTRQPSSSSSSSLHKCQTMQTTIEITKEERTNGGTNNDNGNGGDLIRRCHGTAIVNKCEGVCVSNLRPSINTATGLLKVLSFKECICCRETSMHSKRIILDNCFDNDDNLIEGDTMAIMIEEPRQCACFKCSN